MAKTHKLKSAKPVKGRLALLMPPLTAAAVLFVISVNHANPAYYHDLAKNQQPCSDCHTLHFSEAGARPTKVVEPEGGPFTQLLIGSTTNMLCLFCHDGTDVKAPDVVADGLDSNNNPILNYYSGSGDEHSGAGYFANSGGATSVYGHDLGVNTSLVKFSTMTNVTLTCASCHDPHGTPNYRNILTSPAGGTGVPVVMQKDVYRQDSPSSPPSNSASIAAYKESNLGYRTNSSKWCTECHDELKPLVGASSRPGGSTPNHHIVDKEMNTWSLPTVATAHWVAGPTGLGFGTQPAATGDSTEGVPRLRFQVYSSATMDTFTEAQTVAENNEVMCMTCHLAHGGKYKKGLVWPKKDLLSAPNDKDTNSGCDQCHNGAQQ